MKASLLAIGDEVLNGLTVDTNSGFLAQLLRSAGLEIDSIFTVADEEDAIIRALERALADSEIVVSTGGLGPTADDLTSAAIARFAERPLELHAASLERIERRFRDRGAPMPVNNRKQALLPRGSIPIPNPVGTAPGFICPLSERGVSHHVIALPGVPVEMQSMAEQSVLPWLASRRELQIGSRVFGIFGITESQLDERLAGIAAPDERLSFRAAFPTLQARVTISAASEAELEARLDRFEAAVRERLGSLLYAVGDEGLEVAVGRLLKERGLSLALAESCTGGLIGHRITEVPGSSSYFLLGVVAYSNQMKEEMLGVPGEVLAAHGAVSEATVLAMARGVRRLCNASIGLATSGIAGPEGGRPDKPVGTIYLALSSEEGEAVRRLDLGNRSRSWNKEMTAQIALDWLRRYLIDPAELHSPRPLYPGSSRNA